jgi:hypothetical protein
MRAALKFLVFFIFLGLVFTLSLKSVHAQTSAYNLPNTDSNVPRNLHTYSQSVLIEVSSALMCQLTGVDVIDKNAECLGINPLTKKIGYVQDGGLLSAVGSLIAMTLNPPVHSYEYTNYLTSNFGIAKPALASTCNGATGFCALSPLIKAWTVLRDLAYMFLIVIFIAIGLAIMLRVKIDPRTVMTISNQIPKIIIALILVTFSFAIAGLLIDFMWLIIYLMLNIFKAADPTGFDVPNISSNLGADPINFVNNLFTSHLQWLPGFGLAKIALTSSAAVAEIVARLLSFNGLVTHWYQWLNPAIWIQQIFAALFSAIAAIAAIIIISVALLVALIRIWFALLTCLVTILIDVVIAPLWIISGIIPGSGGKGFSNWFRHISSKVIVFPITISMFFLAKLFIDVFAKDPGSQALVPLVGLGKLPDLIASLIGLGIILITPKAQSWAQEILKAPKTSGISTALMQSVAAGAAAPKRLLQYGGAVATQEESKTNPGFFVYKQGLAGKVGRMFGLGR